MHHIPFSCALLNIEEQKDQKMWSGTQAVKGTMSVDEPAVIIYKESEWGRSNETIAVWPEQLAVVWVHPESMFKGAPTQPGTQMDAACGPQRVFCDA